MKIYLAGPLFTTAEREFNATLANHLRVLGHEVWLPQENEPRDKTPAAIFAKDLEGLHWCDTVVANMDGSDPDSGTAWECGWAYAMCHAIVLFRTDFRSASDGTAPFNLMLSESAAAVIDAPMQTARQIAERIHQALQSLA